MRLRRQLGGFTLIEMMIVVAVIAIIASIAYPNYSEYLRKGRRAECASVLLGLANAMERRFSANGWYFDDPAAPDLPFAARCPVDGGVTYYNVGFVAGAQARDRFVIQAVPTGPQTGDACGTLTINQAGVKGQAAGMEVRQCW